MRQKPTAVSLLFLSAQGVLGEEDAGKAMYSALDALDACHALDFCWVISSPPTSC